MPFKGCDECADEIGEAFDPISGRPPRHACHCMIGRVDAAPDTEIQPAVGQLVDGDGLLGEYDGIAIDRIGYEHR
jgi:hypothetical protein